MGVSENAQEIKDMANYESSYRAGDEAIRDCIENFLSISNTSSLGGQAEQTSQTSQIVRNQGAENIEASGTTRSARHTETSEVAEAAGIELSPSASLFLEPVFTIYITSVIEYGYEIF